ncbi:hypothetical protein [Halobaculum litoreum]|uniref:DUF8056 domain-containing protein n=1 Tax=Halobaculum litoreum TaxID=3031998 RepID=A0ABD5XKL7_9EURY|nr:hypothetical protein [Halobaculum sp. DT92]
MTDEATSEATSAADADTSTGGDDGYRGVFGAFPYAFRASESLAFKSYVVVGGLAAALLSLLFALALVTLFGATAQARFSIVRAFYVVVALGAVAPTVAPVLLVARARRRGTPGRSGYELGLALAGYLFLLSLYLGTVAALPETFVLDGEPTTRPPPTGAFAPAIEVLYALPRAAGLAIPAAVALLIPLVYTLRR